MDNDGDISNTGVVSLAAGEVDMTEGCPCGYCGTQSNVLAGLVDWWVVATVWLRSWWLDRDICFDGVASELDAHFGESPWAMYLRVAPELSPVERRWLARECLACLRAARPSASFRRHLRAGLARAGARGWTRRTFAGAWRRVFRVFVDFARLKRGDIALPCGYSARPAPSGDPPPIHMMSTSLSTALSTEPSPSPLGGSRAGCAQSGLPPALASPPIMF